jgi:hypothetical protein
VSKKIELLDVVIVYEFKKEQLSVLNAQQEKTQMSKDRAF